ncbi:DUF1810 domain-containing protein [Breznakiellaceae bacterium SP9]
MDNAGLERFIKAQENKYQAALREIKNGRKESHWMWYIFPQAKGLGLSDTAEYYGIRDIEEARAYLADAVLGQRLYEIAEALLTLGTNDAQAVFGYPDYLKLRSSMTLFAVADETKAVFQAVLKKYFAGEMDQKTIQLLHL